MAKESSRQIFSFNLFVKGTIILWRCYINISGCVGMTISWSETILSSLKENIVFVKLFETSFGSDRIASFTEF